MLKKKEIVVIDGYNVLRNSKRYADVVGEKPNFHDWSSDLLNAAREALLNDVEQMIDKNCDAIIVYDAARRVDESDNFSVQQLKNVQIIFTNYGESADERIQRIVMNARKKNMEVRVITSDLGIQDATMNEGVVRMSSREFETSASEISKISHTETCSKIEDIVDNEIANKLRHLRDSL